MEATEGLKQYFIIAIRFLSLTFYIFRLANLGRFEKAVEDFQKALKYNPTHSNARKYICETLVELGKQ